MRRRFRQPGASELHLVDLAALIAQLAHRLLHRQFGLLRDAAPGNHAEPGPKRGSRIGAALASLSQCRGAAGRPAAAVALPSALCVKHGFGGRFQGAVDLLLGGWSLGHQNQYIRALNHLQAQSRAFLTRKTRKLARFVPVSGVKALIFGRTQTNAANRPVEPHLTQENRTCYAPGVAPPRRGRASPVGTRSSAAIERLTGRQPQPHEL
jgi:hypothetical protein